MLHFYYGETTKDRLVEYAELYNKSMMHLHAGDFMVEPIEDWYDMLPSVVVECRDDQHHLCGIAMYQTPDMLGAPSSNLTLVILAVDPDVQKQGIGQLLIQQSFRLTRELGFKSLIGYVREDSPSMDFYKRMGFSFGSDRSHVSPEDVQMIPFMSKVRHVPESIPSYHPVQVALLAQVDCPGHQK